MGNLLFLHQLWEQLIQWKDIPKDMDDIRNWNVAAVKCTSSHSIVGLCINSLGSLSSV